MLEIILIWTLAKKIAAIATSKGRSATGYVVLFIFLWVGGEISGLITGAIIGGEGLHVYLFALAGAAGGAVVSFVLVNNLPSLQETETDGPGRLPSREENEAYREKWRSSRPQAEGVVTATCPSCGKQVASHLSVCQHCRASLS